MLKSLTWGRFGAKKTGSPHHISGHNPTKIGFEFFKKNVCEQFVFVFS